LGEIDATLCRYLESSLAGPTKPSSALLQQAVNDALAKAETGLSLEQIRKGNSAYSEPAFILSRGGADDLYAAGFAIGFGNVYTVFLHGLKEVNGGFKCTGPQGGELDSSIPHASLVRAFGPHELRFLACGTTPFGRGTVFWRFGS